MDLAGTRVQKAAPAALVRDSAIRGKDIMKLSARNVLSGKIVAITLGATTAHVKIEIGQGAVITASITNEAVEALALEVGKPASAVIKASDVIVGVPE